MRPNLPIQLKITREENVAAVKIFHLRELGESGKYRAEKTNGNASNDRALSKPTFFKPELDRTIRPQRRVSINK
jgi:hypothetical protein